MAKFNVLSQRLHRCWLLFGARRIRPGARIWRAAALSLLVAICLQVVSPARSQSARGQAALPPERTYPLPSRLEAVLENQIAGQNSGEDYLNEIRPSPQGYLLWSTWPVQVYLEPSRAEPGTAEAQRQASWQTQAEAAIADWSRYLPLEMTDDLTQANITILRQQPPLRWDNGQLGRARHAETRFRITAARDAQGQPCLSHQQTVYVGDRQGPQQLRGTLRHELGHALGLWGHSPYADDALYAGQIADPPAISKRDLNTLRRLYRQPTRLGCSEGLPQ